MKKSILILTLYTSVILVGCNIANQSEMGGKKDFTPEPLVIITEDTTRDDEYKVFKNGHSMNWDFVDEEYLLKIAQYKGGTVEDKAYTILVTLNRVWDEVSVERYSEYTISLIQDVVLRELYEVDGLMPSEFEEIIPDETTKEAMRMIKYEGFDNSNGSLEYKD